MRDAYEMAKPAINQRSGRRRGAAIKATVSLKAMNDEERMQSQYEVEGMNGNGMDGNGMDGNGMDGNGMDGNGMDGNGMDGNGMDGNHNGINAHGSPLLAPGAPGNYVHTGMMAQMSMNEQNLQVGTTHSSGSSSSSSSSNSGITGIAAGQVRAPQGQQPILKQEPQEATVGAVAETHTALPTGESDDAYQQTIKLQQQQIQLLQQQQQILLQHQQQQMLMAGVAPAAPLAPVASVAPVAPVAHTPAAPLAHTPAAPTTQSASVNFSAATPAPVSVKQEMVQGKGNAAASSSAAEKINYSTSAALTTSAPSAAAPSVASTAASSPAVSTPAPQIPGLVRVGSSSSTPGSTSSTPGKALTAADILAQARRNNMARLNMANMV
jgi:hypothetical protein